MRPEDIREIKRECENDEEVQFVQSIPALEGINKKIDAHKAVLDTIANSLIQNLASSTEALQKAIQMVHIVTQNAIPVGVAHDQPVPATASNSSSSLIGNITNTTVPSDPSIATSMIVTGASALTGTATSVPPVAGSKYAKPNQPSTGAATAVPTTTTNAFSTTRPSPSAFTRSVGFTPTVPSISSATVPPIISRITANVAPVPNTTTKNQPIPVVNKKQRRTFGQPAQVQTRYQLRGTSSSGLIPAPSTTLQITNVATSRITPQASSSTPAGPSVFMASTVPAPVAAPNSTAATPKVSTTSPSPNSKAGKRKSNENTPSAQSPKRAKTNEEGSETRGNEANKDTDSNTMPGTSSATVPSVLHPAPSPFHSLVYIPNGMLEDVMRAFPEVRVIHARVRITETPSASTPTPSLPATSTSTGPPNSAA